MEDLNSLSAIASTDGRYWQKVKETADYFSEFALFKYRIFIETRYLIFLSKAGVIRRISPEEEEILKSLTKKFDTKDALKIKQIEDKVRHDIKAVEYFLKEKIAATTLSDLSEMVHFGLTSEDTNNLAYALSLDNFLKEVYIPCLTNLLFKLRDMSKKYAGQPMLARTHGQPAIPTTFGKEIINFYKRIDEELKILKETKIKGKLNGAVGNFSAQEFTFPEINWPAFSLGFISSLKLEPDLVTTQIEHGDSYVRVFDSIRRINTILIGFCQDIWRYISDDYLKQKVLSNEVGSSTLPQKVNPINFENAEGNLGLANAFFKFYGEKLLVSRLQRDLSDSPVRRTFGEALALSLLSYKNIIEGLERVSVNSEKMEEELTQHWEIVAEAVQTTLRLEGHGKPYEKLKELTRGKTLQKEQLDEFIGQLRLKKESKEKLKRLSPLNYLGLAEEIVRKTLKTKP